MVERLKYYFVLPRLMDPVGGANVLIWLAETLRKSGFNAAPLYPEAGFRYPFLPYNGESFYTPSLRYPLMPKGRFGLRSVKHLLETPRSNHRNTRWKGSAKDVFVLPEFIYPQCIKALPPAPFILAAQDVFGLSRAFMRDQSSDIPQLPKITTAFTTSEASFEATTALLGPVLHRLRLPVCQDGLKYQANKKLQIAYMPRKRRAESDMVIAGLKMRPALLGIPIIPIEGMSDEARNRILSESLIFLSFSEKEGFGLPPAEAMASGSIVIGYTGVGGNEYFTSETGIKVEDSDIFGFINTIENTVTRYRADPAPLDALRQQASQTIWDRYNEYTARQIACATWAQIDQDIRRKMPFETIA